MSISEKGSGPCIGAYRTDLFHPQDVCWREQQQDALQDFQRKARKRYRIHCQSDVRGVGESCSKIYVPASAQRVLRDRLNSHVDRAVTGQRTSKMFISFLELLTCEGCILQFYARPEKNVFKGRSTEVLMTLLRFS